MIGKNSIRLQSINLIAMDYDQFIDGGLGVGGLFNELTVKSTFFN